MSTLMPLVISGIVTGAMYAMTASGLVLAYSASGIFNFAQGAIAFAVAMLYFQLNTGGGWPAWAAALFCAGVVAPLLGLLLNGAIFRRLSVAPVYARIVGTIGIFLALPSLVLFIVEQVNLRGGHLPTNTSVYTAPGVGPVPATVWRPMESVAINSDQLAVWVAAAAAAVILAVLLQRTRLGLKMRADVDRRWLAEIRGVNSASVSGVAWMLTSALAGVLGILLGPFVGLDPISYTFIVLGCMAAVVFAGLRSLPLAFLGGIVLGVIQNLVAGYADDLLPEFLSRVSGLRSAVPYILTVVLLLVAVTRQGGRAAGVAASEAPPAPIGPDLPLWRKRLPWGVFTVLLVGYTLFVADDRWAGYVARGAVIGIILLSFVVVTGMGGMISLAQATFVTAGAFTTGWLTELHGVPFLPSAIAGSVVAGVVGALIALPVRRLGSLELALATLALAFVGDLVLFRLESVNNDSSGYAVSAPQFGPFDFDEPRQMAMLALLLFGVVALLIRNLHRSSTGRAMLATRSTEAGAAASGIATARVKIVVFAISAAIAGFGGALFAVVNSPISPTSATPITGLLWLAAIVTWGVRRLGGALVAGLVSISGAELLKVLLGDVGVIGDALDSSFFLPILFGLGAIGLAKDPDGIFSMVRGDRLHRADRKTAKAASDATRVAAEPISTEAVAVETEITKAALVIQNLVVGYGGTEVLHGVDLVARRGEIVALLGPNGAGKSTLVRAIAGSISVVSGSIRLDGKPVHGTPAYRRARTGLICTPEQRGIFPNLSVEDNLSLTLTSSSARTEVYERFPILGERRRHSAGLLSGGEQQLLTIAPWLVRPPTVLVADEPTLGLSPMASALVLDTLRELRARGVAVILVEEKVGALRALADRVVLLTLGRVAATLAASELDSEIVEQAYFGHAEPLVPSP